MKKTLNSMQLCPDSKIDLYNLISKAMRRNHQKSKLIDLLDVHL